MGKLKFEGLAQRGDTIRAYDFNGVMNCYYEGQVVNEKTNHRGAACYLIKVTRRVWDGTICRSEVGSQVFVPHQVSLLEWDDRVQLLARAGVQPDPVAAKLVSDAARAIEVIPEDELEAYADEQRRKGVL